MYRVSRADEFEKWFKKKEQRDKADKENMDSVQERRKARNVQGGLAVGVGGSTGALLSSLGSTSARVAKIAPLPAELPPRPPTSSVLFKTQLDLKREEDTETEEVNKPDVSKSEPKVDLPRAPSPMARPSYKIPSEDKPAKHDAPDMKSERSLHVEIKQDLPDAESIKAALTKNSLSLATTKTSDVKTPPPTPEPEPITPEMPPIIHQPEEQEKVIEVEQSANKSTDANGNNIVEPASQDTFKEVANESNNQETVPAVAAEELAPEVPTKDVVNGSNGQESAPPTVDEVPPTTDGITALNGQESALATTEEVLTTTDGITASNGHETIQDMATTAEEPTAAKEGGNFSNDHESTKELPTTEPAADVKMEESVQDGTIKEEFHESTINESSSGVPSAENIQNTESPESNQNPTTVPIDATLEAANNVSNKTPEVQADMADQDATKALEEQAVESNQASKDVLETQTSNGDAEVEEKKLTIKVEAGPKVTIPPEILAKDVEIKAEQADSAAEPIEITQSSDAKGPDPSIENTSKINKFDAKNNAPSEPIVVESQSEQHSESAAPGPSVEDKNEPGNPNVQITDVTESQTSISEATSAANGNEVIKEEVVIEAECRLPTTILISEETGQTMIEEKSLGQDESVGLEYKVEKVQIEGNGENASKE